MSPQEMARLLRQAADMQPEVEDEHVENYVEALKAGAAALELQPELVEALKVMVLEEVQLARSGDAGNYDPELQPHIIQARAALEKAGVR